MSKKFLCWWSGGVASAVATGLIIMKEGVKNCEIVMCDTSLEHPDTYRFLSDFEKKFDVQIKKVKSKKFNEPEEVWLHYNGLNFAHGAPCSSELKREVRKMVQKEIMWDNQVFGFDFCAKEERRAKQLKKNYPDTNPIFPLIERKITRDGIFSILSDWGMKPPKTYSFFQNNNCIGEEDSPKGGCVQGGIGYWQKMKEIFPKKYEYMGKMEHLLSKRKGKPVTICKDQRKSSFGSRLFLLPCSEFPDTKTIDVIKGKKPIAPLECNGMCGLDEEGSQQAIDVFDEFTKQIKEMRLK